MIRERRNIRSRGNRDGTGRSQNGARTAMGGWATAGRGEKKRGKEDTNLDCQRLIARTPRQKPGRETLSGTHASRGGGARGKWATEAHTLRGRPSVALRGIAFPRISRGRDRPLWEGALRPNTKFLANFYQLSAVLEILHT